MAGSSLVAVQRTPDLDYPLTPPFHPPELFPEYPFQAGALEPANWVYGQVREMLYRMGLDREHYGLPNWNPLGGIVRPGDKVVIKPNLVISDHHLGDDGIRASVAHGSVIRPLVDYAWIAAGPRGSITICDSPIKEVDFDRVTEVSGMAGVVAFYRSIGVCVSLLDIRDLQATRDANSAIVGWKRLAGDPKGYVVVDLGARSMLAELGHLADRWRSTAAVYENEASGRHTAEINQYSFPRSILEADAVISVAKLKVHRKAGVTLTLKNMVGTTNEKRWLPHHRAGFPSHGGDMCPDDAPPDRKLKELITDHVTSHAYGYFMRRYVLPPLHQIWKRFRLERLMRRRGRMYFRDIHEGDWFGNDTIWRTTLDLNMALRYADKEGYLSADEHRRFFCVVDGIIGGDREGPLHPRPRPARVLAASTDTVAIDTVCTALMGFDPDKIPTLANAKRAPLFLGWSQPAAIQLVSNDAAIERGWLSPQWPHLGFEPSLGWDGHVELKGGGRTSDGQREHSDSKPPATG